jgi:excinuclease UvrABC nuclease subunit
MAEEIAKRIVKEYDELIHSEEKSFRDAIPPKQGVYVISELDHILYVGSARDLERRLKHDLLGTMGQIAQPHTFGRKLVRKLGNKEKAREYLRQSCRLRTIVTENLQQARTLEQFAILVLNPKYNSK